MYSAIFSHMKTSVISALGDSIVKILTISIIIVSQMLKCSHVAFPTENLNNFSEAL